MSPASDADRTTIRGRLERGAWLARVLSGQLCHGINGHERCDALHGIWPALRRLGLAAEPARHADFYRTAFAEAGAESAGAIRLLVAGCADWGMLELAVSDCRALGIHLDVTVVDRCATPVLLSAWYGSEVGLAVRTAVADLADYIDRAPFDVICTHSILGYAPLSGRRRLVANWHALLRPGGRVITVSRLMPLADASAVPHDGQLRAQAAAFAERVAGALPASGWLDPPADLGPCAERFARAQVHHPVGDAGALRDLFEVAGFTVPRLEVRSIEGPARPAQALVGAARGGIYGEIVAVRQ